MLRHDPFASERAILPRLSAVLTAALALVVLAGWSFDIPLLRSVLPGAVEMKANTAAGLLLAGGALFIFGDRRVSAPLRRVAQAWALAVTALGLGTLGEYLFGWRLGIDELLFRDTGSAYNVIRGRMSPYTAVAFAALGLALAGLPLRSLRPLVYTGVVVTAAIGAVSALGYLWSASELVTDRWLPPVAINTALAFLLLASGVLLASRAAGSQAARPRYIASIERKIVVGFIGALLLLLLGGGYTYRANVQSADVAQSVARTEQLRAALGNLRATFSAGESAQRDYLLTGASGRREDFAHASADLNNQLEMIGRLVADEPAQQRNLEELRLLLARRFEVLTRVIARYDQQGLAAARVLVATERDNQTVREIRALTERMDDTEAQLLVNRGAKAAGIREITLVSLLGTLAVATAIFAALFHAIRREMMVRAEVSEQLRIKNEEVTQKNLQLEQASRSKSEFLATMSHELRTPLNAIIGFSEVLRDGLVGELTLQQREHVGDVLASGEHLLALINDILDLSKIEAGKMELYPEPVQLRALLENSLSMVKEKALANRIRLRMEVEEALPPAWLDPRKVKQILYNLLSNAVKFTGDGGAVTLTAGRLTEPEGDQLRIAVTDTGIGIAPKDQERLFDPFVQIDSSLARNFEGTGLGLAMVKRLTALHGGRVTLTSHPGKGSTFVVQLPFRSAEAAEPCRPAVRAAPKRARALALVIEDDDNAAELLRIQLESEGLEVLRARDGDAGFALARERSPDIITLDVRLPGRDGWDVLTSLKSDMATANIPVVIVSIVADRKQGLAVGAAYVLQKPIDRQELRGALTVLGLLPSPERQITTLVVDDDPKSVDILGAFLKAAGGRVVEAFGGREGIELARRLQPDLIILDLMMPDVSGFDVVEALKGNDTTVTIPIIVVTARVITAEDRALLDGQVVRLLEKAEFSDEKFLAEVRRALGTSKVGRRIDPLDSLALEARS